MIDPLSIGVMAGGQLLGGLLGSSSARKAAQIQAQAQRDAAAMQLAGTREANALLQSMYGTQLGLQAPQLRAGQTALSALMSGMGLGPLQMAQSRAPTGDVGAPAGAAQYLDASGRPYAGPTMTDAQGRVVDARGNPLMTVPSFEVPSITQEQAEAAASPYAGTFLEKFTGQDIYRDPSYEFRLSEGERLLRARQAAGGNRFGGQALKDIVNYGQQAASQEYGSAFDRFMKQKEQLYSRLAGLAGTAGSTAERIGQAGSTMAGEVGRNITTGTAGAAGRIGDAGTALAGGVMGSTNRLVEGIGGAGNTWLANQYFNAMNPGRSSIPTVLTGGIGGGPVDYTLGTGRLGDMGMLPPVRLGG